MNLLWRKAIAVIAGNGEIDLGTIADQHIGLDSA